MKKTLNCTYYVIHNINHRNNHVYLEREISELKRI